MSLGTEHPSLNSLIFEVCRGPAWKRGKTIVAGILRHLEAISVIASLKRPLVCYESSDTRVKSKLTGKLSAFSIPRLPDHAKFLVDSEDPIEDVGILFLFDDCPVPCMSFVSGAIIVGDESKLREALRGRKFIPRAYWRNIAAMEIQ